ncbi:hypothetical protein ACP4OV_023109 [Aristida adscensionis]
MATAVAWRSASAVAGLLAGKLGELAWDEATLLWSFKDDVDDLKDTMKTLNAMMCDADSRSGQDQREIMRVWMEKFKCGAYDVEDLLDKFEAIELMKQSQSKIKLFFSSYNPLLMRVTMAHKIKKVKKDLEIIKKDGQDLNLVPNYNTPSSAEGIADQATVATKEDTEIRMIGRDNEKDKIIKLLLKSEAECVSIIPIVGLGGLGKTTLARAVFSDKIAKTFDLQVWVSVSKAFNLTRIGKIIIPHASTSIGIGTSEGYIIRSDDLDSIIEQVNTILRTKRYLIVLDDVWEEDVKNLEKLKQMLQCSGKGSKIILTTRMQRVVQKLDADDDLVMQQRICPVHESDRIYLRSLSVDECWNVMRQRALGQDDDVGRFEAIGLEIARKCGGLPLLARSLGFLLSEDKSTEAWEEIRDRNITFDMTEGDPASDTLGRLMLSYHYMQVKVKLCFTYCAVFPKGFVVARDHLIQQWRALGYIQSTVDGHRCINYLLGMSFLQISEYSQGSTPVRAGAPIQVTMHDLVHDLSRKIAGSELIVSDAPEKNNWSGTEKKYGRHMQLVNYQKQSESPKEFPRKIRALHFTECSRLQLQQKSFSKSKYLRILDLSGCSIEGEPASSNISLPSNIRQLILLRYLDASGLPISALPKSLHKLQKIQTLIMSNCTLETLSDDIGNLLNLDYFDLSGNSSLKKLPTSLGKLSALSYLKLSGCSKLKELPESFDELKSLRHLDMSGCCALQKLPDIFGSFPKLRFLNLSGCSKLVKLPDNLNLESLEHLNLSSCHELQNLPPDFGNIDKLVFLNLSECYKVQALPDSFCRLKHLKDLDLSDCHDLRELPRCFGSLSELHSLNLASCSKLQSLPESFGDLYKLKHLNLSYCVRIEDLPSSFGKLMLQVLDISACQHLKDLPDCLGSMTSLAQLRTNAQNHVIVYDKARFFMWSLKLPGSAIHQVHETESGECSIVELGRSVSQDLKVTNLKDVKCPEDAERAKLRDYPELRRLTLGFDDEHVDLPNIEANAEKAQLVLENLVPPRTLEEFALLHYRSKDFPNWMLRDISSYLPYLVSIQLGDLAACDSLPPFGRLPNLRLLQLWRLPGIRRIGKEF